MCAAWLESLQGGRPFAGFRRWAPGAPLERPALREQLRSRRAMDRAVNTAAAEQGFIRCVDDRINVQRRDVRNDNVQPRRTDNAPGCYQVDAGALSVSIHLSARVRV